MISGGYFESLHENGRNALSGGVATVFATHIRNVSMDAVPFPHSLPVGDVTPQFFKTGDFYSDSLVACQLCMPLPCVYRAAIIEQVARIVTLDNSDELLCCCCPKLTYLTSVARIFELLPGCPGEHLQSNSCFVMVRHELFGGVRLDVEADLRYADNGLQATAYSTSIQFRHRTGNTAMSSDYRLRRYEWSR